MIVGPNGAQSGLKNQIHFSPETVMLKEGDTSTVGISVSEVKDLFRYR